MTEDAPGDANRTFVYDRTAVEDIIHFYSRDIVEFYSPALDATFNFCNGKLNAWRGKGNLDGTRPTPAHRKGSYFDHIEEIQVPRNVRPGPTLSSAQVDAIRTRLELQDALKANKAEALFDETWTQIPVQKNPLRKGKR